MKNLFSRHRFLIIGLILALFGAGVFYSRSGSPLLTSREKAETRNDVIAGSSSSTAVARVSSSGSLTNPAPRQLTVSSSSEDGEDVTISIPSDRPRFVGVDSPAQRRAGANDVDLRKAATSLRDYRLAFKQNPVGNNREITRTLSGKNSRGTRYLPADAHINDKGQLTDRWDQPVFFHQISSAVMEVRSAGPDQVMWTADDEVLR